MATIDVASIWGEVKANHAALDACAGPHDFVADTDGPWALRKMRCQKCGGAIDRIAHSWYERGLVHGRAAP